MGRSDGCEETMEYSKAHSSGTLSSHLHISQKADKYRYFLLLICVCWADLWHGLRWILIILRIAVRDPDETLVGAQKALVLIPEFLLLSDAVQVICHLLQARGWMQRVL